MVMMDPNCQVVVRIRTEDPPEGEPDPEAERLTALWSEMALAVRAIARDPKYADLTPEFGGWGYTDPEEQ